MMKLYKMLKKYNFEFGYAQTDHMFIRGWISSFIMFNVPVDEQEELLHVMGKMNDSDFPKVLDNFLQERYK